MKHGKYWKEAIAEKLKGNQTDYLTDVGNLKLEYVKLIRHLVGTKIHNEDFARRTYDDLYLCFVYTSLDFSSSILGAIRNGIIKAFYDKMGVRKYCLNMDNPIVSNEVEIWKKKIERLEKKRRQKIKGETEGNTNEK